METIILASGSPRRQELLAKVRIPFKAFPPNIPEELDHIPDISERVRQIALKKIEAVVAGFPQDSPRWVLGLDTLVELDGQALAKPTGPEQAAEILKKLSGRVHRVYTGIGLLPVRGVQMDLRCVATEVKFAEMTSQEVEAYVESGEWSGVAGAYRIQERGGFFVEWIRGSYSNVVGLPLETFYGMLKRNQYPLA
ncbi:MAG TPA: nucleoside triphosphate pyrophosphatase [Anaerolineales bacterium]|nr:nucleoside triphosphate pyrophosphatase [Anaerolineales bacterium]